MAPPLPLPESIGSSRERSGDRVAGHHRVVGAGGRHLVLEQAGEAGTAVVVDREDARRCSSRARPRCRRWLPTLRCRRSTREPGVGRQLVEVEVVGAVAGAAVRTVAELAGGGAGARAVDAGVARERDRAVVLGDRGQCGGGRREVAASSRGCAAGRLLGAGAEPGDRLGVLAGCRWSRSCRPAPPRRARSCGPPWPRSRLRPTSART